ncbi:MAG: enoyl-CoA hydratase/isomerase family protein [Mycobacterium sp.]
MSDEFDGFRLEVRPDGVAVVTFDRPATLNSVNARTLAEFERAVRGLGDREDCGAVVITGANGAFTTGMDLSGSAHDAGDKDLVQLAYAGMRSAVGSMLALRDIRQPVIAAVSGPAVGAGFAFATAADVRFGAPDAMFIAPFLKLGVSIGDMGLSWMLPRLIGPGAAAEVLYSGAPLGAEEAHRLGLLQHVVPEPLEAAIAMAAKIASRPRLAVQMSKELLNASISAGGLREHMEMEMRSQVIGLLSADHRAALKEFAARRKGSRQ